MKEPDEIVVRFHVFCSPDFDLGKGQNLSIVGMAGLMHEEDPWKKQTAKMEVYKTSGSEKHKLREYHWTSGFFKTKKRKL